MLQNRHIFASVLTGSAVFMWGKILLNWGKNKPRSVSDPETYWAPRLRLRRQKETNNYETILVLHYFQSSKQFVSPHSSMAVTTEWQYLCIQYGVNLELVLTTPCKNIVDSQYFFTTWLENDIFFSSLTKLRE